MIEKVGEGLVSLIESGKIYSFEMTKLLNKYLQPMLKKNIDFLVLGCTHYPFLIPQLKKIVGEKVTILDSGKAIARQTKVILEQENLLNNNSAKKMQYFYVNKHPEILQNFLDDFHNGFIAEKLNF